MRMSLGPGRRLPGKVAACALVERGATGCAGGSVRPSGNTASDRSFRRQSSAEWEVTLSSKEGPELKLAAREHPSLRSHT